jgi:hypothetical protein
VGKDGAGAGFHPRAHIVVLFLAALEGGGEILLDLNGLNSAAVAGTDAKGDPVAKPEQENGDDQGLSEQPKPANRLVDEGVRASFFPVPF